LFVSRFDGFPTSVFKTRGRSERSPYDVNSQLETHMGTRLFVGNLSWGTNDQSLQAAFAQAGSVVSASVITDKMTGRSKGFGFVEMGSESEAAAAIDMWNGKELDGRQITVNEARPREERR
jgi:cold-inducible RNA-binding protein